LVDFHGALFCNLMMALSPKTACAPRATSQVVGSRHPQERYLNKRALKGILEQKIKNVATRPWSRLSLIQLFETETVLVSEGPMPR
jgi:hypothetical protein